MSYIETGVFAFMVVFAFGFMLFAFRVGWPLSPFLRFLSIAVFMATAVLLASGFGVQTTRSFSDGTTTWTEITPLIPADGTGIWMNYIFVGFGILNLVFIVREIYAG